MANLLVGLRHGFQLEEISRFSEDWHLAKEDFALPRYMDFPIWDTGEALSAESSEMI